MYPLEMVRASGGKLSRGTVYTLITRLEDKGFVVSRADSDPTHSGMPRNRYQLTALGVRALAAAAIMGMDVAKA